MDGPVLAGLLGTVLPAVVAGGALALAVGLLGARAAGLSGTIGALAFVLGFHGWLQFEGEALPIVKSDTVPLYLAALAGLLAPLEWLASDSLLGRLAVRLVLSAGVISGLIWNKFEYEPPYGWQNAPGTAALWIGGFGLAAVVFWTGLDLIRSTAPTPGQTRRGTAPEHSGGPAALLAMAAWAVGASGVLAATGAATLGMLLGTLAAVLTPAILITWWRPTASDAARSLLPLAGSVGLSLVLAGVLFSDTPALVAAGALLAPLAALVWRLPVLRGSYLVGGLIGAVAVGLVVGACAGAGHLMTAAPADDSGYGSYGGDVDYGGY